MSFVDPRRRPTWRRCSRAFPTIACQCPHWGYVIRGRMVWTFADREEVYEAGDAFYVPGGHTPLAAAGSEFVIFSTAEQLAPVEAVMQRNMLALQGA